jgi:hypothetical protein
MLTHSVSNVIGRYQHHWAAPTHLHLMKCFSLVALGGAAASCSWKYHYFFPFLCNSTTISTILHRHLIWDGGFCTWCFCGHFLIFPYYTSFSDLSGCRKFYLGFRLYDLLLRRILGEPMVLYFLQQQGNRCLRFLEHCVLAYGYAIFGHTVLIAHCCNCT